MMKKIVTLGEIMLRLSPPNQTRFEQANTFEIQFGGGEANVAVSLSRLGNDVTFISKIPQNEIGNRAIQELKKHQVNTNYIARGGKRLGLYYLESGIGLRGSKVIYDREYSSISEAMINDFDFDHIFKEAQWFHFTGITPALSESAQKLTLHALQKAKEHNVKVSCDLNYRKKLWSIEKAREIMIPLMEYVDVCIGNEEDVQNVLGLTPGIQDINTGHLDKYGYQNMMQKMKSIYAFDFIYITLRESFSATHNGWSALLYDGDKFYESTKYQLNPILDRVGGGDAFAAGVIHGILNENPQYALEFGVASSALKHMISGDFNLSSVNEVRELMLGNTSGRVVR